jgi:predicted  nucleic acid-binding Zn-ribbon protein
MYKDLLSKEEMEELLSHVPEDEADAHRQERTAERSAMDHKDLAYQYLQETVRELQREIGQLRNRLDALEKRQRGAAARKEAAAAAEKKPAPAPQSERPAAGPDPAVHLSRVERHKSQKSKWF